jgi:hypothetical protein
MAKIDDAVKDYENDIQEAMKEINALLIGIDKMPKPEYPERYSLWGRVNYVISSIKRDNKKLLTHITELEKQLADLTPHPDDAGYEADYDDHSRGW